MSLAYTEDSRWRNRVEFIDGREAIRAFLTRKWNKELDYRLIKELWGFRDNRMAVRFAYEWHDDSGHWFRSYGNELWEFDEHGLMRRRIASINDLPIVETDRKYSLARRPASRRPSRADRFGALERFSLPPNVNLSLPRRRNPGPPPRPEVWIPAFAGMTIATSTASRSPFRSRH